MIRRTPPDPDTSLDPFVDGLGVLSRDGFIAGHVATVRTEFHTLFSRKMQWWIWSLVIWSDGTRERPEEDYPPWTSVTAMKNGYLDVLSQSAARAGRYNVEWLSPDEARAGWAKLGISQADF